MNYAVTLVIADSADDENKVVGRPCEAELASLQMRQNITTNMHLLQTVVT